MKTGEGWFAVWPVVAFFLGGLATQVSAWLGHRRQRAERAEDAVAEVTRRREEFELAHLVEFNGLLRRYVETYLDLALVVDRHRESQTSDGITAASEALAAAEGDVLSQVGFILDDDVRRIAGLAVDAVETAVSAKLEARVPDVAPIAEPVNRTYRAVSARVREIYSGRASD
ncbi:hypothetical protein NRF20_20770 [Streptomyces sp. R-74717]|uniref:hypothetical protein n=1 Tax=Streptomyces sp. R-74717 TaxID=2969820 RepID=UPI0039B4CBA1